MTKTKLAFVRCRLSCFSCRPVRFFPRLFPFACLLLFACRRFRCPALGLAGFFPRRIFRYRLSVFFLVFSFPPSGLLLSPSFPFCLSVVVRLSSFSLSGIGTCRLFPAADFSLSSFCFFIVFSFPPSGLLFSPSFPFCLSVVVRLSSFSLSGIGTCRLFPAADFSLSSFCFFYRLFLPAVRFAFFPSFPFCRYFPSLFVFSFVAFCIWSFFSAFFFSFFSVLFFLFYREAASGRKTGGHGRRMALKLFLPMARQKETPPKRGKFYK